MNLTLMEDALRYLFIEHAMDRKNPGLKFDSWLKSIKEHAWDEGVAAGLDKGLDIAQLVHKGGSWLDISRPPKNPYRDS